MISKEEQKLFCDNLLNKVDKNKLIREIELLNIDTFVEKLINKISKYCIIESIGKTGDAISITGDFIYKTKIKTDWSGTSKKICTASIRATLKLSISEENVVLQFYFNEWTRTDAIYYNIFNFDFEKNCIHTRNGIRGVAPMTASYLLSRTNWSDKDKNKVNIDDIVKSQFRTEAEYNSWLWTRRF